MPVEGFPDASRHKLCLRCQKWHEPEEGVMVEREITGPFKAMRRTAATVAGLDPKWSFMCHRCLRIRRYTKAATFGTFAFLVVVALILGWLKVI